MTDLDKAVEGAEAAISFWVERHGYSAAHVEAPDLRLILEALRQQDEALGRIVQWSEAYPLDIFPEPDFKAVHAALKAAGLTLDAVSASNMRHVVTGVGSIARAALTPSKEPTT